MEAGSSARQRAQRLAEQEAELEQRLTRVRRERRNWEAGQQGEELVAAALSTLPPGWRVLHDRYKTAGSPANIDHIAIGPTGVYAIDAKNWGGQLRFSDRGVLCGKWPRNRETESASAIATLIADELRAAGFNLPVYAVIALANEANLSESVMHEKVAFIPAQQLVDAMTDPQAAVTPEQVYRAWEFLDDKHPQRARPAPEAPRRGRPMPSGSPSSPRLSPPPWLSPMPPPAQGRRAQRRRKSATSGNLGRAVLVAVVVLVVLSVLPALAREVGRQASRSVANNLGRTVTAPPTTAAPARLACKLIPASRASQLLGVAVRPHVVSATFCEYRKAGSAQSVAVVASGPGATSTSWTGFVGAVFGVSNCGVYVPAANGHNVGACVDTTRTRIDDAHAWAFDSEVTAAAQA